MATNTAQLLIILGAPASGKTTLARRLGEDLCLPILSKDDVKEALLDVLECADRETSRRFSDASFAALVRLARTQLSAGVSCIVEGNWRAEHAPVLRDVLPDDPACAAQIRCRADPREIVRRFSSRRRHAGHLDALFSAGELAAAAAEPPGYLDLGGPRWGYESDAAGAYEDLLTRVKSWRL